jgi:hypothetical protein
VDNKIKIGFCVAYDWYLLKHSLPLVYKDADSICLSIDNERRSWAGEFFSINENEFFDFIEKLDIGKKIRILQEDFHLPHLTPMQNEVRQRNRMADFLGHDGWHIQLDCDEYFLDFSNFVNELRRLRGTKPVNICCALVTLYKNVENGFLYVKALEKQGVEFVQVATNVPVYEYGRRNGHFNRYTRYIIIHQSWARSEEEISQKLFNWGHKNDFDAAKYLKSWKKVSKDNYKEQSNLHPISPSTWPKLEFVRAQDIHEFNRQFSWPDFPYSTLALWLKNSRMIARINRLIQSVVRR